MGRLIIEITDDPYGPPERGRRMISASFRLESETPLLRVLAPVLRTAIVLIGEQCARSLNRLPEPETADAGEPVWPEEL